MLDLPALYAECAPQVHPITMAAVVRVESGGRQLALNVNRKPGQATAPRPPQPTTVDQAEAIAIAYIQAGHSVDLGLSQINSRNLPKLGYTIREVLESPCKNIAAGAAILTTCYDRAIRAGMPHGDPALVGALSCYNTNDLELGVRIGYTSKYGVVPPMAAPETLQVAARPTPTPLTPRPQPIDPRTADSTVRGWSVALEPLP